MRPRHNHRSMRGVAPAPQRQGSHDGEKSPRMVPDPGIMRGWNQRQAVQLTLNTPRSASAV